MVIHMEAAFILKNGDDLLFIWPQLWFDTHKFYTLWSLNPLHHPSFKRGHQGEEDVVPVFDNVQSLMAIHVHSFFHPYVPLSQQNKPSPCRAL
jgi:hypothetical protein